MTFREEVALFVRGYLEDECMERTLRAFNQECKLKLSEKSLDKKLVTVLAEHREWTGGGDELDMPHLWKRLDVLLGHLRFVTMPRAAAPGRSQSFRSRRGNTILRDQRRGVQPFTVTLQHSNDDKLRWQQNTAGSATHRPLDNSRDHEQRPTTPPPLMSQGPQQRLVSTVDDGSSLANFPVMTSGDESSQGALTSSERHAYNPASAALGTALRSPRRKSTRPQRKRPVTESPLKDRLAISASSTNAAEQLVETILSMPSLQSKFADEINQNVHGSQGADPSEGFSLPITAAAVDGTIASDALSTVPADASADDTVARVLEWMHTEPAFDDMPWSEFDAARNTGSDPSNAQDQDAAMAAGTASTDPLDQLLMNSSVLDSRASPSLDTGTSSLSGFYSPVRGSLLGKTFADADTTGLDVHRSFAINTGSVSCSQTTLVSDTLLSNTGVGMMQAALPLSSALQSVPSCTSAVPSASLLADTAARHPADFAASTTSNSSTASRAMSHVRSLNFDAAPLPEASRMVSFVQSNAISVFPPVDTVATTSVPSVPVASASDVSQLSAGTAPGMAASAHDEYDLRDPHQPPPKKKKKKKKKSKHSELEAFPANVDVDGFLSKLSYD